MGLGKLGQSGLGVLTAGAVLLVIVLAGIFLITAPIPGGVNTNPTQLAHFSSYEELVTALQKAGNSGYGDYYSRGGVMPMFGEMATNTVSKATALDSSSQSSSTDYSKTNIQVEGVDEADIIKNDGKYIYAISNGKLNIVDAFPAENAKIISTIDLNGLTPTEMFISENSNKLVLFANGNGGYYSYYPTSAKMTNTVTSSRIMPWGGYNSTAVIIYNISDKSNPTIDKQIDFEGSYLNSRLIGKYAYFVINSYPTYTAYNELGESTDSNNIIPLMRVNGVQERIAMPTEIGIMPRVMPRSFITIASLNLENLDLAKETVLGSANNLYSSQNNLYLAEKIWEYSDYNGPIPIEAGMLVKSIYFPNIGTTQKTTISKFNLNNGKVTFTGQGVAPGSILNQFSMDEYNNNFRIATTVQNYNPINYESTTNNNVYVFNSDMNMVGAIEGIAPNETIYSARFMGDKGYLVTFKTVDPLFVLDLSNPSDPRILGKLKIPGYSDYMQPLDETHILGIGKDVNEETDADKVHTPGAVYYTAIKGVKMAIFDVTDVTNPIEMHKVVIGERGTESEALNDHKALLLDMKKNLLVIPITLVENVSAYESYGQQTFQGAYVYNISLENGFVEKGRITHVSNEQELKTGYYYDSTSQVRRSLYMDNALYTFSENMLKANNLTTLEPISDVNFPQSYQNYNGYSTGYVGPMMVD